MNPRLGMFGSTNDIEAVSAAGFDCIELQVNEIVKLDKAQFRDVLDRLQKSPIVCGVLDNPVPLDKVVADDDFDLDYYQGYIQKGAERAEQMGVKYYIFGNGRTRSLPASGDVEKAKQKNLQFMRMLADITSVHGIRVLLEPLAPRVSNVIQSLAQALDYAKEVGKSNIGTFLDYRWFLAMNHPLEDIRQYGRYISHVHIDNPTTEFPLRLVPKLNDGHDYSSFFKVLEEIDFEGIISIEANTFTDYQQDLHDCLALFSEFGIRPARSS